MSIQTANYTQVAQALFAVFNAANTEQGSAYHEFKLAFPKLGEEQAKALTADFRVQCLVNTGFSPMSQSQVKKALESGERLSREQLAVNALFKSFQNTKSLLVGATKAGIDYRTLSKPALEQAVKAAKPEQEKPAMDEEKAAKAFAKIIAACEDAGLNAADIFLDAMEQVTAIRDAKAGIEAARENAEPAFSEEMQTALFSGK